MTQIKFATYREMHPEKTRRKLKQLRDYLRYYIRKTLNDKQIKQFINYLTERPQWAVLFQQNPYRFNTILAKYCDNRFNRQQRLEAIINNFNIAEQTINASHWQTLMNTQSVMIVPLTEEFSLHLNINNIDPFEGFFAIHIQNQQGEHFYDASFSFAKDNQLLITSIQGPNGEHAQEQVKKLTKALHGIRPMYLLVMAFKLFSLNWKMTLIGIPHNAQAKYRWNDSSYLLFNYDSFWQENKAKYNNNYWLLPLEIERKALDEIPSKKRSMYRKRYEMLDKMEQAISQYTREYTSGMIE